MSRKHFKEFRMKKDFLFLASFVKKSRVPYRNRDHTDDWIVPDIIYKGRLMCCM